MTIISLFLSVEILTLKEVFQIASDGELLITVFPLKTH